MPRGAEKLPLLISPGGVREDVDLASVPDGWLLGSSNWLTREGKARPRPGYEQMGSTLAAADRVLGIGFHGSPLTDTNLVVHTVSAAYEWDGAAFNAITGTWTSADPEEQVRFTVFNQGGTVYLIRINEDNAPDEWNGTGNFTDVSGSPPAGRDITSTNGRLVVLAAGGDEKAVRWSGFNDRTAWSAADIARLTDTPGEIIAGRAFGPKSLGIYLEDAVYYGVAQAAKAAFAFEFIGEAPGPLSTAGLVSYRGRHYWLAHDGAIYRMAPGGAPEAIGTHLMRTVRNTLDWTNRRRAHGCILPLPEPELWYFYPEAGAGTVTRAISMNLTTGAMNPHTFAHEISASSDWTSLPDLTIDDLTGTIDGLDATYPTIDAMGSAATRVALVGTVAGKVHRFNATTNDDGTAIAWEFTHGWRALSGMGSRFFFDGLVSYWRKMAATLTVTVGVTVTDSLGDDDSETTSTFDLATDSEHLVTFDGLRGQWVKVRHAASSSAALEHRGSAVLGWKRGMV